MEIGMLASAETISVVADAIEQYEIPLSVVDPVEHFVRSFTFISN